MSLFRKVLGSNLLVLGTLTALAGAVVAGCGGGETPTATSVFPNEPVAQAPVGSNPVNVDGSGAVTLIFTPGTELTFALKDFVISFTLAVLNSELPEPPTGEQINEFAVDIFGAAFPDEFPLTPEEIANAQDPTIADIDADGAVDLNDFAIVLAALLGADSPQAVADICSAAPLGALNLPCADVANNEILATLYPLVFGTPAPVEVLAADLVALNTAGELVFFSVAEDGAVTPGSLLTVTGLDGNLLGIDSRSSDGLLYGLTDSSIIFEIDTTTGAATEVSTLTTPVVGPIVGLDFNPVPDRLRILDGVSNLRANVDTGEVAVDADLAYADGAATPMINGAGYTNNFIGPASTDRTTQLFNVDFGLDALVLQNPPNDGTLSVVATFGIDIVENSGFEIFSPEAGINGGYLVNDTSLFFFDVEAVVEGEDIALTPLGELVGGPFLDVTSVFEPVPQPTPTPVLPLVVTFDTEFVFPFGAQLRISPVIDTPEAVTLAGTVLDTFDSTSIAGFTTYFRFGPAFTVPAGTTLEVPGLAFGATVQVTTTDGTVLATGTLSGGQPPAPAEGATFPNAFTFPFGAQLRVSPPLAAAEAVTVGTTVLDTFDSTSIPGFTTYFRFGPAFDVAAGTTVTIPGLTTASTVQVTTTDGTVIEAATVE